MHVDESGLPDFLDDTIRDFVAAGKADEIDSLLNKLSREIRPTEASPIFYDSVRGSWLARQGRWEEAISTLEKGVQKSPASLEATTDLALLMAYRGLNLQEKELRPVLPLSLTTNQNPTIVERLAFVRFIMPFPRHEMEPWVNSVAWSVGHYPSSRRFRFQRLALALGRFRLGEFDGAESLAETVWQDQWSNREERALAGLIRTLAAFHKGDWIKAEEQLADAERLIPAKLPAEIEALYSEEWRDWVVEQILLREARGELQAREKPAALE